MPRWVTSTWLDSVASSSASTAQPHRRTARMRCLMVYVAYTKAGLTLYTGHLPWGSMAKRSFAKPRATGVQLGSDVARNMILFGATRVFATKGIRDVSVEDLL